MTSTNTLVNRIDNMSYKGATITVATLWFIAAMLATIGGGLHLLDETFTFSEGIAGLLAINLACFAPAAFAGAYVNRN